MKRVIMLVLTILSAGCTTLRPLEGSPDELQRRIATGELLKVGDRVLIGTADSQSHRLTITRIDAGRIVGRRQSIPIDQVVLVEKRCYSRGKTTALVMGLAVLFTLGGLLAYTATHLPVSAL